VSDRRHRLVPAGRQIKRADGVLPRVSGNSIGAAEE